MTIKYPLPANEFERIINLSEFDLDYTNLQDSFENLARLAAKIAGSEISLVNLIDTYTQWTISSHGISLDQMGREESVCQYTIVETDKFEVSDLTADDRFKNKFYVVGDPHLKYYYGIPLRTKEGINIGALCVMDKETKILTPEKTEMLQIIAEEVVNRLKAFKAIAQLQAALKESNETKKRIVHDVRGPLAGIIGLTEIIAEQGDSNKIEEVMEFINLINKSSSSILDLANEILTSEKKLEKAPALKADEYNQLVLKEKLLQLYTPQAMNKNIKFEVHTAADTEVIPFSKNKLLQIIGNLISNAIKFTPEGGQVVVDLKLKIGTHTNDLIIQVRDTGIGLSQESIDAVVKGQGSSTNGTEGEIGFGFGLALVKHLVETLDGILNINSIPGKETIFEISLPQPQK
ncbi:GAF domain-containing sensor histidine kinase [Desertivirga arenae]|uniref:GAF domain-containing sensor histidine kinase n=1 Tax=Desertivirga arenae TaxID=2810309 RepID=UPI001A97C3CD|nr:GAF domain-containing sensor histidine kinase [Pedobacter sp. SYSU D00823]